MPSPYDVMPAYPMQPLSAASLQMPQGNLYLPSAAPQPAMGALVNPTPLPNVSQVSTDQLSPFGHAGDTLNQLIVNKTQQQNSGGLLSQILAQRFQPTFEDTNKSIMQSAQAFGAPDLYKPATPQDIAQQRMGQELSPYTTMLDLQTKQAGAQEAQAKAQYAPELQQADIAAKRAQAGFLMNGMGGGAASSQPQLSGNDYLKTLPPQIATQVKALAEGRMQFPGGFALKSPYWQQMVSAVSTYDPSFDAVNYNARAATRKDFTSGKSAQNINALNTVIGHLQTLSDAADKMNNSSIPAWNNVANTAISAAGDPRVNNFNITKKAVVDELTRVYRGSGGSEGDIKTWSDAINATGSPAQLHEAIAQIGDLLESKVNALGDQYNQGLGTTSNPIRLTTPKAESSLAILRKRSGAPIEATRQIPTTSGASGPDPALIAELKRRGKM